MTQQNKVECEIEDLETGCTYIRKGATVEQCIADFQEFFFIPHRNKVLWQRELKEVTKHE